MKLFAPGALAALMCAATISPAGAAYAAPSIGTTVQNVETALAAIYGSGNVSLASSTPVEGVPRVSGEITSAETDIEVYGSTAAVAIGALVALDTSKQSALDAQLRATAELCEMVGGSSTLTWCEGRILNANKSGLVSASATKQFASNRWIAVKTTAQTSSAPPFVGIVIAGSKAALSVL